MSEKIEALLQQMQELTTTVKEHKDDGATLDWDTVKAEFEEQIHELVGKQVEDKLASQPVRRGAPIGAFSVEQAEAIGELTGNRYAKIVRDIARDGEARSGPQKLKAVDFWLAKLMLDGQARIKEAKGYMPGSEHILPPSDDLKAALKALTATGSGTGDELVPTDMAAQLWDDIFLASKVVAAMAVIEPPTDPYDVPLGLGDVTWRKGTENTATTASDPATAKSTMTFTELVTEQNWSYSLQEDAVVAMAPEIRRRLAISGGEIVDDFALNADATNSATGNINLDDADPADDSYYLSAGQDGIRHQWLVDADSGSWLGVDAGGDALADADVLGMLVKMGKYAVNPEQCIIVCDASTYLKGFLNLDGVLTIDKFGPAAVLLTGQLAAYRGIPLIVSASHPLGEADGKVSDTASSNTLGSMSCFNRLMWYAGFKRRIMIEVDRDIQKRQYLMVTSLREAVAAHGTRASATHTAGAYNILVS